MAVDQPALVHETEVQRRHARVKIPASIVLDNSDNKTFELDNLSSSGFGINDQEADFLPNQIYSGRLSFNFLDFSFNVPVRFTVVNDPGNGRIGCEFQDLGRQEISTIRLIITKYLSGEVIQAGDLLSTINRENFAKPRKNSVQAPLTGFGKFKGIFGTALFFCVGLIAFSYLITNIYNVYWVENSTSATITLPYDNIYMPREGRVFSKVEEGQQVKAGQIIATIESPLYDLMEPMLLRKDLSTERLSEILQQKMYLDIKSPCDCRVFERLFTEGQFVSKSKPMFSLSPKDSQPLISASFPYESLKAVDLGQELDYTLAGSKKIQQGKVTNIEMFVNDTGSGYVTAEITPNTPLEDKRLKQPVHVSTHKISLAGLISNSRAGE
ncbi:HlyD family efflux transporter periplasmic adaptor subunit [Vibrio sp. 404]|uniref:HlyD family efflux transporter periplasmic adaptor subunit n=1 Tax=Vibrio marinisediminis TaxID=2758441 RepID=A0A7W2FUB5_9VIBR|nr:HlyD family efflux transporter periplasmic adaptor subunit [Vibrio marinisediminis]MBA5764371.1 HlyD family efflux transporter periplasmic adaptor subunit [Vibrio marinisediminis]